jgi:hypothetical protein
MLCAVKLYHSTDKAKIAGIREHGFAVSHVRDSPGSAWFTSERRYVETGGRDWLVVVEMPPEEAEKHRAEDLGWGYTIKFDIVNRYRPFHYEPLDPTA